MLLFFLPEDTLVYLKEFKYSVQWYAHQAMLFSFLDLRVGPVRSGPNLVGPQSRFGDKLPII